MNQERSYPKNLIRILHPITRLIVGGAQENTMYTAALLDKNKFFAEILSGPQTGSEGSLIGEVRERNIPLTIIPELIRPINPFHDIVALIKIYRYIKQKQFTIVHTHSSKAGILGRLAARMASVPIIIHTVHGWSFHERMPLLIKKFYIHLERITASFTKRIIVVTNQDISKGLREKIGHPSQYQLIRSAIPLAEFDKSQFKPQDIKKQLGIPLHCPVLGTISRFSKQKNPFDWIRIAIKLAKIIPDCHFLMVGDGPLRSNAEEMILKAGIRERLVLTGIRRDVAPLLSIMDVFLLTSLWEGLPRVIPQAMMMEIPVVAYRVDGLEEIIQNGVNGFLCNPGDIQSAVKYCHKLLTSNLIRPLMGAQGKKSVENEFELKTMIHEIEQLYYSLLSINTYG